MSGVVSNVFKKCKKDSPLAVLEVFDQVYQRETGNASLFDLTQRNHLHKWAGDFKAPSSYWKNQANVEEAIYHTLTEAHPELGSDSRDKVINGIKDLTKNLQKHFHSLGLGGLMSNAFEKGKTNSPLAVLEVFDEVYQRKTGDASLFDLMQKNHLHKWGDNFRAPNAYWKKRVNIEEAIYHTLTETHSELGSKNRDEVIKRIKELPTNLRDYFISIGLCGVMIRGFKKGKQASPLAVLEVFDEVYQRKTGDASLFDKRQDDYLKIGKRNMLVRDGI